MARNRDWFRFYTRMIDSPEVLELDDSEFRLLVSTWCLAKVEDDHGSVSFTRITLRRRTMPFKTAEEFDTMIDHLISLDLLWEAPNGKFLVQRWDTHQYEYPSRVPSNRSDYGKTSENNRKENGKDLEAQGQIEPEPEPEPEPDLKDQEIPPVSPPKSKQGNVKRPQPLKQQFAPHVHLTAKEHRDLVAQYGEVAVCRMIEVLDAYKEQSGKIYQSDAGAIRNWVVERVTKEGLIHAKPEGNTEPLGPDGKPAGYWEQGLEYWSDDDSGAKPAVSGHDVRSG